MKRKKYLFNTLFATFCLIGFNCINYPDAIKSITNQLDYGPITVYAAEIGDMVTSEMQVSIGEIDFPETGSTILKIDKYNTNELLYFSDGTAVMNMTTNMYDVNVPSDYSKVNTFAESYSSWITDKERIKTLIMYNSSTASKSIEGPRFANLVNMNKLIFKGKFNIENTVSSVNNHTVGGGVFYNSKNLSNLYILDDLSYVSDGRAYSPTTNSYTFEGNEKLCNIYIGKNVTSANSTKIAAMLGWSKSGTTTPRLVENSIYKMTEKNWSVTYESNKVSADPNIFLEPQQESVESLTINKGEDISISTILSTLKNITFNDVINGSISSTKPGFIINLHGKTTINSIAAPAVELNGIELISNIVSMKNIAVESLNLSSAESVPTIENAINLNSIVFPSELDISSIKNKNFYSCPNLILDLTGYTISNIGSNSFYGTGSVNLKFSDIKSISSNGLSNVTFVDPNVMIEGETTVGSSAFSGSNLNSLVYSAKTKFNTTMISGANSLSRLYILSGMDSTSLKADLPSTAMIYCEADSSVETWCKNNSVAYKTLTDEEIEELTKGKLPTLEADSKLYDADDPKDISFMVDLGKSPAGATGISKVLVDNNAISTSNYNFDEIDSLTLKADYLKSLYNGTHSVSVLFNNGTFKSGASIFVMSSTVPVVDPTKPPEALDTIKYEFYKDYPDYVIIPVSLNGASKVTKLKIGSEIVPEEYYELEDAALVISNDYLQKLDPGKYRILPTFDDPAITTINNLQLLVYNEAADRAAPYLLQSRIVFKGDSFTMKYDPGYGDLETSGVLALVLDDKLILQNGEIKPFSNSNINNLKLEAKLMRSEIDTSTPSEAARITDKNKADEPVVSTPSQALSIMGSFVEINELRVPMENELAFNVNNNEINVNGSYISSLGLEPGNYLLGAIFENSERTTDVKKVILTVMDSKTEPEKPSEPEVPNKPDTPSMPETPSNPGGDNGGSSDSGSSSGGSGKSPTVEKPTEPENNNSQSKPIAPDDGGSFIINPDNPYDVDYRDKDGNPVKDKWVGNGKNWYHVNEKSKLDFDWFFDKNNSTWYMLERELGDNFGSAKCGWHYETKDQKWYYLSTRSTSMLTGWQLIDSKWYYLTPENGGPTYFGDNIIGWKYDNTKPWKPLGSMYQDEKTPDGYTVDTNGAWTGRYKNE
ncbi:N-acetylmuramoyl-L-alanine amidase family protein [Lacrimispora amygdalina]|uniref:N-acetylmuramoyl-L-alanine amidase family protein n=1 Tax=Lacrimispora amygdalina TaxID=253257 RepID=UPI000BE2B4E8|nr:leucine-rich repeat protein [Lacrimispora amygdalina]